MFHKIASVSPVGDMMLEAVFQNGDIRRYDVSPLLARFPQFAALREVAGLFDSVHVEAGGYGISWNDDLDIESEDIWELGVPTFLSTNQKPEIGKCLSVAEPGTEYNARPPAPSPAP